eukprot:Em0017g538a
MGLAEKSQKDQRQQSCHRANSKLRCQQDVCAGAHVQVHCQLMPCGRGSKGCSGHNAQGGKPGEVSSPSHNLMAIWCSLGSRLRPRPGDGQCQRAMQKHGEKTQTGDEPCQK